MNILVMYLYIIFSSCLQTFELFELFELWEIREDQKRLVGLRRASAAGKYTL